MNAPLTLQIIKSLTGKPEYVLIPFGVYKALQEEIEDELAGVEAAVDRDRDYVPLVVSDYIKNPIRALRIEVGLSQKELAKRMKVTQAYISKVESRKYKVSGKLLTKARLALKTRAGTRNKLTVKKAA